MSVFKLINSWHHYMKTHEHDFNDYVKNKGWESFRNNDYSFQGRYANKPDDFKMGFKACYEDYHSHKRFKNYPLSLIKCINKIFKHRMNEIVDYIDGYVAAKQKIKRDK